jgi:hypothetical protein
MLYLAGVIVGVLLFVWLFHLLLRRMEDRGDLILTSKSDSLYRSVGNAVLDVESSLQPQKRHVLEAKRKLRERKQEHDNGDTEE